MKTFLFFLIVVVCEELLCVPLSKIIKGKGFEVKVLEQSGMILIISPNDRMTLFSTTLVSTNELEFDGNQLPEHEIKDFSTAVYTASEPREEVQHGISTTIMSLTTTVPHPELNADFTMEIVVFKQAGHITVDSGELYEITPGTVKMNVTVNNWGFCGVEEKVCKKGPIFQVGEFLDLTFQVNGGDNTVLPRKSQTPKGWKGFSRTIENPNTYDLNTAYFVIPHLLKRDGSWMNMTTGYPKFETVDNVTLCTMRFPRFAKSVYYEMFGVPLIRATADSSILKQDMLKLSFFISAVLKYLLF